MVKNYIKIALRNLRRFKGYTLINLLGLSIGLTVSVLILLFVTNELGFDKFQAKGDRIYKVVSKDLKGGHTMETNAWPVAYKLKNEYPEVEAAVYSRKASLKVRHEGKDYEQNIYYANNDFFKMFSFPMLEGNPENALKDPYSLVITRAMEKQYFGHNSALGKTLTLDDSLDFKVTGVVKDIPAQSHIQFDMLISFSTYLKLSDFGYDKGWGNFNVRNYILLKKNANIQTLVAKAGGMYMDKANAGDRFRELGMNIGLGFIPLNDIYLKSDVPNGFGPKGSIDQVYLLSGIAIFMLLIACINFVNLTTARATYRAKEVGIRKVIGSTRNALLGQFLSESFVLTFLSFLVSGLMVYVALPFFNQLVGRQYNLQALMNYQVLTGAGLLILLVSLLSGYYPAWVLSAYKPAEVLKGKMQSSVRGVRLRRFLVGFQFFISGAMVLGTLIVLQQLDYMRNQDLGFNKEQVLVLDASNTPKSASFDAFKLALSRLHSVEDVAYTNALPGKPGWLGQWAYPDRVDKDKRVNTEYMAVDEDYIKTLGLQLVAGRNFSHDRPSELKDGVIINETTARQMGWENPEKALGHKIVSPSGYPSGTIIGVVKDYHDLGLQQKIWPQVMDYTSDRFGKYYAVKFRTGETSELIANAKKLWRKYIGDTAYEYSFLNDDFNKQYKSEEQLMTVFLLFAGLTVAIAVIGLLGLVSFIVVSRNKEIGIRKLLGANVLEIATLLSKEFAFLVILANLLTIPVIWYFGSQWLQNFAYHMQISPSIFLITLIVTLGIAILTVSFQTIKAGLQNPADVLKSE